jgi:hypothetical protein
MTAVQLPTKPQTRKGVTPEQARVFLAGMPKSGKTTLAASWPPKTTLIVDTQHGTDLLDGEHYVQHVHDWVSFVQLADHLVQVQHRFKTIVLDLVDDLWNFCDAHHAGKGRALATSTDDYGRSAKNAEGAFRSTIGNLLSSDLGVWFLTHTKAVEEDGVTRYVPKLDNKVQTYVQGAAQFVFLAETLGPRRKLHTAPSAKFEAGSRVSLPEPMEMDARQLYKAMRDGLRQTTVNGSENGKTNNEESS